ncbi:MAG: fumarate hydratase [Candidatus Omnitrophota bacterium]|jgi:fumarate hydratase subunit alpha
MKTVSADKIRSAISGLCVRANTILRKDVLSRLRAAYSRESNNKAKDILRAIVKNAYVARKERLALCQDTGLPVVFLKIGQNVKISGDLKNAINKGVEEGYRKGHLRSSIISSPLIRGRPGYSPVVIHTDIVKGNKIKITVLPKGFGCENKTQLKMFNPTAELEEVKRFVVEAVKAAGPDACPPYIIGVGMGGTADYAGFLAKRALLNPLTHRPSALEKELSRRINKLNIGPMGLGGKSTCLGVNIETYPTHIAGLPVAVNISCHALRSASVTL